MDPHDLKTSLFPVDPMSMQQHGEHSNPDFSSFFNGRLIPNPPGDSNDHLQLSIINERRLKRMISNRESARRSRMRKKKQIEDLQCQVNQIQAANHQLSERLLHLLECNHQILQENVQLKEKVASLQIILSDVLMPIRGIEEVPRNVNLLKAAQPSNAHSVDLLL